MNYPDSVRFLYSLGNELKTAKFGLERSPRCSTRSAIRSSACRFVHVAGTNGKGSTCAMIESGLRAAGLRTGLYTSPHLVEPTERIRIDGARSRADEFAAAFDRVHACRRRAARPRRDRLSSHLLRNRHRHGVRVCFSEMQTEDGGAGSGAGRPAGRHQCGDPELCVITPVDFDHEAFLGKSLEAIAGEKAGILKPGVPAVFAAQRPEAQPTLDCARSRTGYRSGPGAREVERQTMCSYYCARRRIHLARRGMSAPLRIALPAGRRAPGGERRRRHRCPRQLGVAACGHRARHRRRRWPGRLDRVSDIPEIILDGAHNPAGARALAAYIERFYSGSQCVMIYGAMRDKAVAEMTGILFPLRRRGDRHRPPSIARRRSRNHTRPGRPSQRAHRARSRGGARNGARQVHPIASSLSPARCFWWARLWRLLNG